MLKKLLSVSLFAVFALSASAFEVGDFVYTRTAKFKVDGANLVTNGQFKEGATGTDGWNATDVEAPLANVFMQNTGGPNGSNSLAVIEGQNALACGIYQAIPISQGGTYVLSFKIMGAAAGFTDNDLTGASTNYINFYYNTDGTIATSRSAMGEGNAGGYGNEFSYGSEGFEHMAFSLEAPAEGYLLIDLRALADGLEVADFECHAATEVYDNRVAERRIEYMNTFLAAKDFTGVEFYEDLLETVDAVKAGIAENASPEEMGTLMDNMELVFEEFLGVSFGNYIDYIPTKDGSPSTGNNSANWMNWYSKWNKLSSDYKNQSPWSWSTDRWCHKTAAVNSEMAINWQRGAAGNWNNVATLTVTLKPGEYFWGVSGKGACMALTGKSWDTSMARDCAGTQLFFNGDTTEIVGLSPLYLTDLIYKFTLEGNEPQEVQLGIICNITVAENNGFYAQFFSPVLLKLLDEGELTPEEEMNISSVIKNLATMQGVLDKAYGYLDDAQVELPWGKTELATVTMLAQFELFNPWSELDTVAILDKYGEGYALADSITALGTNVLNEAIKNFEAVNKPLTDMPVAIAAAKEIQAMRIYSSSSVMDELTKVIAECENLYNESLKVAYSEEAANALIAAKEMLEMSVDAFKSLIDATTVVDIDFGTTEAPTQIIVEEQTVDEDVVQVYKVQGATGVMILPNIADFELGVNGTDSLGMLRVGNGEAYVDFSGAPAKETDIVNIQFDMYWGSYINHQGGFKVLSAEGDTICGLSCEKYYVNSNLNTFDIDYANKINSVGSSSASNAAIAAASNCTNFDIVLDYGAKKMYCTTSGSKGTVLTETISLPEAVPARFVVYSNYDNADRRCWFDNLLIRNIAAGPDTGISEVISNGTSVKNMAIYNLAGQRIAAPVKGQIYIQNGKKFLHK